MSLRLIIFAARFGHAEAVQLLAGAGVDLAAADHHGSTALHRAAYQGSVSTIEAVYAAGQKPKAVHSSGGRPEQSPICRQ